jgi:hypothetical protein
VLLQAYGAALAIIIASLVLGLAVCAVSGADQRWWAAPAVGLAALIVVTGAAIKLPGHAVTAVGAVGVVLAAGAAILIRRGRRGRLLHTRWGDLLVAGASLLGGLLPFIASGRVGLPGVGLDNDTSTHLLWAEALRSPTMAKLWGLGQGYPLGPHSLVATLGTATGMPLDLALTGLLVATVPITALVAAGVLANEAPWRRAIVGLLCSLAYLVAAYYGEGAFKETIMACLLLAFVIHIDQLVTQGSDASATKRLRLTIPAVVLVAGAVYTFSYAALAWFGLSTAVWILAEALRRPSLVRHFSRRDLSRVAPWLAGATILALVLVLPIAGQAVSLFRSIGTSPAGSGAIPKSALGNLITPLSPLKALGIWWSPDFRLVPATVLHCELSAFALAVLGYGMFWSVRRRRLLLPATVVACAMIWLISRHSQSPYVTAKALVIASPVVIAVGLRALLTRGETRPAIRVMRLGTALLFAGLAAYSSFEVLQNEPVQAPEAGRELAAFHHVIGTAPVLFLGADDYSPWQLRDAAVSTLASGSLSVENVTARPNKPSVDGKALDFDSVALSDLDRFRYVVTSNSPYASQAPANFRLLASMRLYDLWGRTGASVPRQVIEPPGAPGGILDCGSSFGKRLRAARGQASVMTAPLVVSTAALPAGASRVPLALPPGTWELSIQYASDFELELTANGKRWTMPAYLGRLGPFFRVGAVTGRGVHSPLTLMTTVPHPSLLTGDRLGAGIPTVAATRIPDTRRIVPLSKARGQYVDWYRVSAG